jgi:predicted signal transduction protein with EAL and GGDEF domain
LAHLTVAVNVQHQSVPAARFCSGGAAVLSQTGVNPEAPETGTDRKPDDYGYRGVVDKMRRSGISAFDLRWTTSALAILRWPGSAHRCGRLKIDQAFIRNLITDPGQQAIIATIIALGHALGLSVIAEGVETEAQCARVLHELGCRLPRVCGKIAIPADEVLAWWER